MKRKQREAAKECGKMLPGAAARLPLKPPRRGGPSPSAPRRAGSEGRAEGASPLGREKSSAAAVRQKYRVARK